MDAGDKEPGAFLQDGSEAFRLQNNNMSSTVKSIAQSCVHGLALAAGLASIYGVSSGVRDLFRAVRVATVRPA